MVFGKMTSLTRGDFLYPAAACIRPCLCRKDKRWSSKAICHGCCGEGKAFCYGEENVFCYAKSKFACECAGATFCG